MSRSVHAILSTENLLHNLATIQKKAPNARIIAMVKANAYGHGLRSVSLRLQQMVSSVGVASIDEALALRKVGIKIPITLMEGVFEPDELLIASCEKFHVVFHSAHQIEWLEGYASLPVPLVAWLKIDTGMGRIGFAGKEVEQAYARLSNNKYIVKPIGCMSHFACADEPLHSLNNQQIEQFIVWTDHLSGPKSICNSAAIFAFPDHHYDIIRPGLALYGVSPFVERSALDLELKPVMTVQTRLIGVRIAQKDTTLGYGARFVCPEDMPIGILAMGYGDGYPRSARDGAPVLINGIRCPIIGRVSMDMMTIDLRPYPQAQVNDLVVLWGENLPIEEVAQYTDNCPYDILTAVQSRVKFHWTQSNH
jgi:alanine racemase